MRKFLILALVSMTLSCKARNQGASQKSINDDKGRVFGLVALPGQGLKQQSYGFRLCNSAVHRASIDQVMNDGRICINPYVDDSGKDIIIAGENFSSMEAAESKLRTRGYTKGAAVAAVGVVGGVFVGYVGGAFLALPYASAGAYTSASTANMLVFGGSSAGAAAGGFLGYSIWGANDRETANRVSAILDDFRKETRTDNVIAILKTFGGTMGWTTKDEVDRF